MNPNHETKTPEERWAQTFTISGAKPNDNHIHNWLPDGNLITSQKCGQCGIIRITPEYEFKGAK